MVCFFIAGKGPLLDYYKKQIQLRKLDNIKFLGFVDDMVLIKYYISSDLVIMPVEYGEGFGLPIIEGYLFNKPVIASNRCAVPEVIISKDFLFENNQSSIIEKIDLLDNNKNSYNYKNYYNKYYSNKVVIERYNSLYDKHFKQ